MLFSTNLLAAFLAVTAVGVIGTEPTDPLNRIRYCTGPTLWEHCNYWDYTPNDECHNFRDEYNDAVTYISPGDNSCTIFR